MRPKSLLPLIVVTALGLAPSAAGAQVNQTTAPRVIPVAIAGSQVLVRVTVKGKPAYMQVDTGASSSIVDSRSAKTLGLPAAGKPEKTTTLGCTTSTQPVAISDWSVASLPLPALTIGAPRTVGKVAKYKGLPVIGLLGNDALSSFGTVAVDFLDKRLVLGGPVTPTGRTLNSGALVDKATGQVALFVANVTIGGRNAQFGIDTGAALSTIENRLAKRLKLKRASKTIKVDAVTCKAKVRPVLVTTWRSGKVRLPVEVALARDTGLTDVGLDGLLGATVLSSFGQVTFDYVGKQVTLAYPAPAGATAAAAR